MTTSRALGKRLFRMSAGWIAGAGLAWGGGVRANDDVSHNFINQPSFFLPIQLEPAGRAVISEIRVHTKKRPTENWTYVTSCSPNQNGIPFTADGDGEYFFLMQLVDKKGLTNPANLQTSGPNATIVVDTQPPQVELQVLNNSPEGQYVAVRINDLNADLQKLQFFYQTRDQVYRPQECVANKPALFCIPAQANTTGMVRVVAQDLAGNSTTKDMNVAGQAPTSPDATTSTLPNATVAVVREPNILRVEAQDLPPSVPHKMPRGDHMSPQTPYTGIERVQKIDVTNSSPGMQTMASRQSPQLTPPTMQVPQAPTFSTAAPGAARVPSTAPAQPTRKLINTPQLMLEYQIEKIGRSGVGKVEVWMTRDGQGWEKLAEDAQGKSPIQVKLPGDGLYGLTLVVANGRGFGGQPPKMGDTPEGWVEVDSVRPNAEIIDIRQGTNDDAGTVSISWTCRDKNLSNDPVDLFYASDANSTQWQPIAKNLRPEGEYRWTPPTSVGSQTFLRIVARDQAGNATVLDTTQPVALDDLSRPRGRIFNITPAAIPNGN